MKNQTSYENLYPFPTLLPKEQTPYQSIALDLLAARLVVIKDQINIQIFGDKKLPPQHYTHTSLHNIVFKDSSCVVI